MEGLFSRSAKMAMQPIRIEIDGDDVTIVDGDQHISLGTRAPDDEQLCRVIARAFDYGRRHKAREIRTALGVAE
jgi:hypothetical protein